ncbi:MAG: DUF192 domain-containing protein [Parcubacteria group bacterium]|jgi:hypothetical protein
MAKKTGIILIVGFLAAALIIIGLNFVFSEFYSTSWNPIKRVYVKSVLVKAETVSSREKIEQGLAGRRSLAEGRGMLFLMPKEDYLRFWMKGMQFPIDIIWIENGKVIGFENNISPKDDRIFTSPDKAGIVLEVPAGFCDKYGIQVNDDVRI